MIAKYAQKGFTLIESIVAIVVFAVAMVTLSSFLFPEIAQSGKPHYEVRASALAQSFMTEVLARGYADNSDTNGGLLRCGELGQPACTEPFGPDSSDEINNPKLYNDVDDYIGCWTTNTASESLCSDDPKALRDILGDSIVSAYPNFAVFVEVEYESIAGTEMKKVTVEVLNNTYGSVSMIGYRGNY
jgi:MSHA pilin protein MshD